MDQCPASMYSTSSQQSTTGPEVNDAIAYGKLLAGALSTVLPMRSLQPNTTLGWGVLSFLVVLSGFWPAERLHGASAVQQRLRHVRRARGRAGGVVWHGLCRRPGVHFMGCWEAVYLCRILRYQNAWNPNFMELIQRQQTFCPRPSCWDGQLVEVGRKKRSTSKPSRHRSFQESTTPV